MDKSFFPKTEEWNEQVDRIPWLLNVCRLTILLSMFVLYMMSVFSENAGLKKMVPPNYEIGRASCRERV